MHPLVRRRSAFINIVISVGLYWGRVSGSTAITIAMGDPPSTHIAGTTTVVPNRPNNGRITVSTTEMSDPPSTSTAGPTTVANGHNVRILEKKMFDTQICPFPQEILIYKLNYGFEDTECFVPKVEQTEHYTTAVDECNGRLACDRCKGFDGHISDNGQCEHSHKDYVELEVECLVDKTRSWGMSTASAGDTFESIVCPNNMLIQIVHVFYGVRNDSDQSALCWHVLKFQEAAIVTEIENKCNDRSACDGIVAISRVIAGACGRNEAVESTDMAIVYDCLDMRDHSPPASCPSDSETLPELIIAGGAAGGGVFIIILIITTILVVRKRKTMPGSTNKNELDPENKDQKQLTRSVSNDYRRGPTGDTRDEYLTTEDVCYATVEEEEEENYDEIQFAEDDPVPEVPTPCRANSLVEGDSENVVRVSASNVRPDSGYLQADWRQPLSNVTGGDGEDGVGDDTDIGPQIEGKGSEFELEEMPYVL